MPSRTSISLLLLVLLVLAGCGRPRGGRGGSSDDDDAANDDDSAADDDDATGDDDDATGDDDDDDDDDDDGAGDLDGDWAGECSGSVLVVGLGELECVGPIGFSVVGGSSTGTVDCTITGFPVSCGGSWSSAPTPGTVVVEMPACFVPTMSMELVASGTTLIEAFADEVSETGTFSLFCEATRQ